MESSVISPVVSFSVFIQVNIDDKKRDIVAKLFNVFVLVCLFLLIFIVNKKEFKIERKIKIKVNVKVSKIVVALLHFLNVDQVH